MSIDIKLADVVGLREARPCGSYEWDVVRVSTDIGLKCLRCQPRALLARDVLTISVKEPVPKSDCLTGLAQDCQRNRRAHK